MIHRKQTGHIGVNYFVSHFYQIHFTETSVNHIVFSFFLFLSLKYILWSQEMKQGEAHDWKQRRRDQPQDNASYWGEILDRAIHKYFRSAFVQ